MATSKLSSEQQAHKRVKVTLACVVCRKKKVKCDGIQPSCSRCQSIGNCCEYSEPPKKRGPPKGYVEVIENRAHRIESILGNQPQFINHSMNNNMNSNSSNSNNNNSNISSFVTVSVDKHNSDIMQSNLNPVITESSHSSKNALLLLITEAVDHDIVHGSHGIMHDFLIAPNVLFPTVEQDEKHISDLMENESSLLWTDNFFNHFNFMFPILSRPLFTSQLEHGQLNPLLKLAVFTLGCRFENKSDPYHEKRLCKQFFMSHDLLSITDLSTVQAILIMCWYTHITGDINRCNLLRHQLSQLIRNLNLGYESNHTDIQLNEMKRRAFWVSFVIDQWLASCTGGKRMLMAPLNRPWDCKYPQLEDNQLFALVYQQKQPNLSIQNSYFSIESALQINSFSEMIRLSRIVADMCNGNNANHLESKLTEWLLHLPSYLDYGKATKAENEAPSPLAKLYRILYYTVQIMLNHNNKDLHESIVTSICTTAANTIIHISEQMVELGQQKYLFNVFFTSLTLATSIRLDHTLFGRMENGLDENHLNKIVSTMKAVNCTLLPSSAFDQLMNQLLTDKCSNLIQDNVLYPSPSSSSSVLPQTRRTSHKRSYPTEEDDHQQFMNSPSSFNSSIKDIQESIVLVGDQQTPNMLTFSAKQEFDINDIFPAMMVYPLTSLQENWPEWLFDESTTDSTRTPVSYITPSHSPPVQYQKEDYGLFVDQDFFTLL